jgi:hypothetical protein
MPDGLFTDDANTAALMAQGRPAGSDGQGGVTDPEEPTTELLFALYADDVRLGIVRPADITDPSGALSAIGGTKYRRRAVAILRSLSRVPDAQIVQACQAEDAGTPRGAAARVELHRRGLGEK